MGPLAYWLNVAKKLAAPVEGRITHNQWIKNPENAAKLGVTVEEAAKAHPDLVTVRQLGRNTDINPMADGAMTDEQLRRISEMVQGLDLNPATTVRVGDSVGNLYRSPSMMEFLGAERVKDLPQGWKDGGVAKMAGGGNKFKPITGNTPSMLRDAPVDRSVMDGNMPDPNDMSIADKAMLIASLIPAGRGVVSAYKALSPLARTAAATVGPTVALQDPSMMIPNPAAQLVAMSGDAEAMPFVKTLKRLLKSNPLELEGHGLYVNPTQGEITEMWKSGQAYRPDSAVRLMRDHKTPSDVFAWDGSDTLHKEVADALGRPMSNFTPRTVNQGEDVSKEIEFLRTLKQDMANGGTVAATSDLRAIITALKQHHGVTEDA